VITQREVLGYLNWAGALLLELWAWRTFSHAFSNTPWRTAGTLAFLLFLAVDVLELAVLLVARRVYVAE
jgi:hypothetical protein